MSPKYPLILASLLSCLAGCAANVPVQSAAKAPARPTNTAVVTSAVIASNTTAAPAPAKPTEPEDELLDPDDAAFWLPGMIDNAEEEERAAAAKSRTDKKDAKR